MSMQSGLSVLPTRLGDGTSAAELARPFFATIIKNRDLIAIVAFCAMGLLVAIYLILSFPEFGEAANLLQ